MLFSRAVFIFERPQQQQRQNEEETCAFCYRKNFFFSLWKHITISVVGIESLRAFYKPNGITRVNGMYYY